MSLEGPQARATIRQCAILAGGLATRLGDIAAETPKPVLNVGGRPFIAWLMREFVRFGVEEFLILTGHLSQAVQQAVLQAADGLPPQSFSGFFRGAGAGWHRRGRCFMPALTCRNAS